MPKRKSAEQSLPKVGGKMKQKLGNPGDKKIPDQNAAEATNGRGSTVASVPESRGWALISILQNFHRTWTLKVVVFCRSDAEHRENARGSGHLLKIIFMYPETYDITDGIVKEYNIRFRSFHPSLEITLNHQPIIEGTGDKLRFDPICCNPVEFEDIKRQPAIF